MTETNPLEGVNLMHDSEEMRDALVKSLAQWICRGWLHTKKADPTEAQILSRARYELGEVRSWGYTFSDLNAEKLAAEATALADRKSASDVNWDQWAFGH